MNDEMLIQKIRLEREQEEKKLLELRLKLLESPEKKDNDTLISYDCDELLVCIQDIATEYKDLFSVISIEYFDSLMRKSYDATVSTGTRNLVIWIENYGYNNRRFTFELRTNGDPPRNYLRIHDTITFNTKGNIRTAIDKILMLHYSRFG